MCCMLASCCSSHIELVLTLCALSPGGTPSLSAMTGGESPAWMPLPLHKPFSAGLTELFLQHFEGFHSIRHFWVWWVCRRESMRSAFWSVCLWVGPFSLLLRCGCVCFSHVVHFLSTCYFMGVMFVFRTQEELRVREEDQQTITVEVELKRHDSEPTISVPQPPPETR